MPRPRSRRACSASPPSGASTSGSRPIWSCSTTTSRSTASASAAKRVSLPEAAARARERCATTIRMVGHGSSDNAASYGVYAFGLLPRWTSLRDSIALTVHYDTRIEMDGSTVLALSQSGRTPDVIEYLTRARRAGALTLAVTNDVDSELALAADVALPLA